GDARLHRARSHQDHRVPAVVVVADQLKWGFRPVLQPADPNVEQAADEEPQADPLQPVAERDMHVQRARPGPAFAIAGAHGAASSSRLLGSTRVRARAAPATYRMPMAIATRGPTEMSKASRSGPATTR